MNPEPEQQQAAYSPAEQEFLAAETVDIDIDEADLQQDPIVLDAASLNSELEQANRRADENWDKLLRLQAEMDNLRRRTEKDLDNARKFALERFAKELLTVVDSLELGIQASVGDSPEVAKLREGSELTLKQLTGVLERFNVLAIDPVGEKFSPERHQAMAVDPGAPGEANTVVKVVQKGYLLNDRLLRPAMVILAQGGAEIPHVDEQA